MNDVFKKILMTGIGAVAYTAEKASEVVEELVKKGEITYEQGKEIAKEYKEKFDTQRLELDEKIECKTNEILSKLNVVTKDDLAKLTERLATIEEKLNKSEQ